MPRKSQALRIEQTQALIAAYQAAGINGTPLRFMVDMERSMARGKYPSKRQRDWLDKLIDEGVGPNKISSDLGISRSAVQRFKKVYLEKIKITPSDCRLKVRVGDRLKIAFVHP